ncbi:MAG: hypothetical protein AAFR21_13635 [Pseudomonadota bacterium]
MALFFAIFKFAVTLLALVFIVIGIIVTPSPIPFGIVLIALGFMLLVAVAPDFVRWLRRHSRWFDKRMHWLEDRLPQFMAKHLRRTDYVHPDEEEEAEKDEAREQS